MFGYKNLQMAYIAAIRVFRPLNLQRGINTIMINNPINFRPIRIAPETYLFTLSDYVRGS